MIAARLKVPVVPIRIRGSNRVLRPHEHFARPGIVRVRIGAPLHLEGEDFPALARQIEDCIRSL